MTLKNVKKYCDDVPEGVKFWGKYKQSERNSNYSKLMSIIFFVFTRQQIECKLKSKGLEIGHWKKNPDVSELHLNDCNI